MNEQEQGEIMDPISDAQSGATPEPGFTGGHMTAEELAYLAGQEAAPTSDLPDHTDVGAVQPGLAVHMLESEFNPACAITLEQLPRYILAIGGTNAQVITVQVIVDEPDNDLADVTIDSLVVRFA